MTKSLYLAIVLLIFYSCKNRDTGIPANFQKYEVENGVIRYEIDHFLSGKTIYQTVHFSNYGSTEYIENSTEKKSRTQRILKKDSIQFLILSEDSAIKSARTFDYITEKIILDKSNKLYSEDCIAQKLKDTIYFGRKCEFVKFTIASTGTNGTGIFWKNIPFIINSSADGLEENVKITSIDTSVKIPDSLQNLNKKLSMTDSKSQITI